jgi:hypothetical protein
VNSATALVNDVISTMAKCHAADYVDVSLPGTAAAAAAGGLLLTLHNALCHL